MSATKMFAVLLSAACTTLNVGAATFFNASHPKDSGMGTSWEPTKKTNQAAVGVSVANVKCRE